MTKSEDNQSNVDNSPTQSGAAKEQQSSHSSKDASASAGAKIEKTEKVDNLRKLHELNPNYDILKNKLDKMKKIGTAAAASVSTFTVGIYGSDNDDEKPFMVLPKSFYDEQSNLGPIVLALFGEKYSLVFIDEDVIEDFSVVKSIRDKFTGLLISLTDTETRKLSQYEKKTDFEKGRTLGFAMRLKGTFISSGKDLGIDLINLLRPDHALFENQNTTIEVGSGDNKKRVGKPGLLSELLSSVLSSSSGSTDNVKRLVDIIKDGIRDLTLEGVDIVNYLVDFETIAARHYRTRKVVEASKTSGKKGKKAKEVVKFEEVKPDKIGQNALLFKFELDIIFNLAAFKWDSFSTIKKDFRSLATQFGYGDVNRLIHRALAIRYDILQRIGNATTKRLQMLRKYVTERPENKLSKADAEKLTKKDIKKELLSEWYLSLDKPVELTFDMVSSIIKPSEFVLAATYSKDFFKLAETPCEVTPVSEYIERHIAKQIVQLFNCSYEDIKEDKEVEDSGTSVTYQNSMLAVRKLLKTRNFVYHASKIFNKAFITKKRQTYAGELRILRNGFNKVDEALDGLKDVIDMDWEAWDAVTDLLSGADYNSLAQLVDSLHKWVDGIIEVTNYVQENVSGTSQLAVYCTSLKADAGYRSFEASTQSIKRKLLALSGSIAGSE